MPIHRGLYSIQATLVIALLLHLGLSGFLLASNQSHEKDEGVFDRFTQHIQQQVESDKVAFTKASGCTNWFYQQEKRQQAPAPVSPIRLDHTVTPLSREECMRNYPGGLDAVRQDFHRTQTSLSVSLTFYEFAVVGDRDDDRRYNSDELYDLFQSLTLPYDPAHPPSIHAAELTERFDAWYRDRNLESLMHGMDRLYQRGYRVTAADRAELDRIMK